MKARKYLSSLLFLLAMVAAPWARGQSYCTPSFTNQANYGIGISNITMGGLSNSTGNPNSQQPYNDYSSTHFAMFSAGATVNFNFTAGNGNNTNLGIFIDWDNDKTFSSGEFMAQSGSVNANASYNGSFAVPSNQAPGVYRMRVVGDLGSRTPDPCNVGYTGEVEDYTFVVLSNSLDISAMEATNSFNIGNNPMSITAANLTAATNITSFDVGYNINGGTPVTQTVNTVNLAPGNFTTINFTNQLNISTPGIYTIKIWARNPNNQGAGNDGNDTITRVVQVCYPLNGTYTIDANGSGGSNFTSFTDAVNQLIICGVNGPVTFQVASGTYTEQIRIPFISGVSATNTISFEGAGQNNTILTYGSQVAGSQYTLQLDGAAYVTLKNMTVRSTNSSFGWTIHMTGSGGVMNNSLYNLSIECQGGGSSGTSTNFIPLVFSGSNTSYSTGQLAYSNTVDSCTMDGGYFSMVFYGNTSSNSNFGNYFRNNNFQNFYYYGIYANYLHEIKLMDNTITGRTSGTYTTNGYGMYIINSSNSYPYLHEITGNRVSNTGTYGIYFSSTSGSVGSRGLIANNMIGGAYTSTNNNYGIYINSSYWWNIYNNSIHLNTNVSGDAIGMYVNNGTNNFNVDARNNMIQITGNAGNPLALYASSSTAFSDLDYNNYYVANGANLISIGQNLTATSFKGYASLNNNSYNLASPYQSATELRYSNGCITGIQLSQITKDIDGDTRTSTPNVGCDEFVNASTNDIGILEISSPGGQVTPGLQNVVVRLKNFGTNTITSAQIQYVHNNNTPVSVSWSGVLLPCGEVDVTFSGANGVTIVAGINNITASTSMPNGVADNYPGNDQAVSQVCPGMSGVFTIDPQSNASNNFKNFTEAVDALSCSGLNGPVTFFVAAGTYNEQIAIRNIQGVSSTNTITFEGGAGNASTRILTYDNSQATTRHTLLLDNMQYVTLRNISIMNSSTSYGWALHILGNNSDNIRVAHCRVGMSGAAASSTSGNFVSILANNATNTPSSNASFKNIHIDTCDILSGYYGVYFYGNGSVNTGNHIVDCKFKDVYYYGIYNYYTNGVEIQRNEIDMRSGNTNTFGMYITSTYATGSEYTRINRNKIINMGRYGIYMSSVDNLNGTKGEIINNMIGGGFSSSSSFGIYLQSSDGWNIYHNSVNVDVRITSTTSSALYASSSTQLNIRNNVFALTNPQQNSGSIYPVYMNGSTGLVCDYNNYYKPGSTSNFVRINGTNYNANNFIGGGGFNNNSYFAFPRWISATDLHVVNGCMTGAQIADANIDFDGDNRPANPTIGADEGQTLDAAIGAITAPSGTMASGTNDVEYMVYNTGKSTITSFTASYSTNGGSPVSISWTGSLAPCDSTLVLFTGGQAATFPASGLVSLGAYVSLVNGGNDGNQNNDSTGNAYCNGPLSGVYTVNPGSSANRNFPDLNTVMAVMNSCGINGDVEFHVGQGTFNGQILLDPNIISGLSSYRVTFEGVDSASSQIVNNGGGYTVRLNGADNVTFRRLGILNTGTSQAFAVHLTNGADNNVFENCYMYSPTMSNTSVITFGIMGPSTYTQTGSIWGENNRVQHSTLVGGYRTVHMYGSGNSSLLSNGNRILDNVIVDGYNYGVYSYFQNGVEITGNYINCPSTASAVVYYSYCGSPILERNYIYGAGTYGVYSNQASPSTSYARGSMSNNMIGGQASTGTAYGIYCINTYNIDFYHNSIITSSTGNTSRAFYNSSGSGNNLQNNIFVNEAPNGYAMYLNTNGSFSTVDFNNLTTQSPYLAYTWGSTFADLPSLVGSNTTFNQSSVSQAPNFVNANGSTPDMHLTTTVAAPSGNNTLGVNVDIDNDSRCPVAKTIGADESQYIDPVTIRFTVSDTVYINSPFTAINADIPGSLRSYSWDFGNDGSIEATTFHATYAFTSAGVKQIKLKSSSCNGADSMIQSVVVISPTQAPEADFIADKYVVAPFETVRLQDLSTNGPISWTWSITPNLGGLVFYDPYAQNPEVFFGEPGEYDICLVAENGIGTSTSKCKSAYITVKDVNSMCIGNLSSSAGAGEIYDSGGPSSSYGNNENCSFLIEPCASSINLKFSEFSVANAGHFLKVYDGRDATGTLLGTYSSTSGLPGGTNGLTATSGAMYLTWTTSATGSSSGFAATWTSVPNTANNMTVGFDLPDSAFVLQSVDFINTSTGSGLNYSWDVDGDGNEDAQSRDVQFIFTLDGVYYPKLIVSDACGNSQTLIDTIVITTPTTPPAADFTADAQVVTVGDTVRFTDLSTNGPISWTYDFSPANGSVVGGSQKDPLVVFTDTGLYEVTLYADNAAGTGTITKTAYIRVLTYCQPDVSTLIPDLGINKVKLSDMENTSASGVSAFTSYFNNPTVSPAHLDAGGTYDLQVSRNTTLNAMNRKVWIDYNADGDFNDAGELVGTESAANTATWTLNFTVPTSAYRGATRMRIGTAFADSTNGPCGVNFYGEVEEYRIVISNDITPPTITLIGGAQIIELGQTYNDSGATAMDAVDGDISANITTTTNLNINVSGTYFVYYNVSDAAGNPAEEVRREVTVKPDITPPIIQLASPNVVTLPLLASFVEPGYTATDAISGNVTASVLVDRSAFDSTTIGTYLIRYVAYDNYNNTDTAWRTVYVVDDIAPSITLNGNDPMDVEVNTTFSDPGVSVTDNYDPVVNATATSNVNIAVLGTYTIQYEAMDASGNISSLSRTVNVVDQTAPVLQLANMDTIVVEVFGQLALPAMSATDNYDQNPQITVGGSYDLTTLGTYTLDISAEDQSANQSAVQNLIVKVVDTEAPVITLNGDYLTTIMRWSSFNDPGVNITDNYYTGLTAVTGGNFVNTSEEGLYYITYDVTDSSGNVAEQVTRAINVVSNVTGLLNPEEVAVEMYPNPASNLVNLEVNGALGQPATVKVLNSLGQEVMQLNWTAGQNKMQIDLTALTPGVYYVQIGGNGFQSIEKLVISK